MRTVGIFGLWIFLLVFAALAAWTAHTALISIATLIIDSPDLRPTYWNQGSLSGISRLSVLLFGSIWLFFAMWSEYYLNESSKAGKVKQSVLRLATMVAVVFAVAYGLVVVSA